MTHKKILTISVVITIFALLGAFVFTYSAPQPRTVSQQPPKEMAALGELRAQIKGLNQKLKDLNATPAIVEEKPVLEVQPTQITLKPGTVIPATLVTAIDPMSPGLVVVQVQRDIFAQKKMFIPSGAKMVGKFEPKIVLGQNRAFLNFQQLVLSNGEEVEISLVTTLPFEEAYIPIEPGIEFDMIVDKDFKLGSKNDTQP